MRTIRCAEVRNGDGKILNIILCDLNRMPAIQAGRTLVEDPDEQARVHGTYDFTAETFEPEEPTSDPRSITQIKAEARDWVDSEAGAARQRHITVVPGQPEVYSRKERDLRAWETDPPPRDPANYPWMRRRAARLKGVAPGSVTDPQMQEVAAEWRAQIDQVTAIFLDIEDTRERAKALIEEAADANTVKAVLDGLTWR